MGKLQHRFAKARIEYWAVYPPPLYNLMEWIQPLGFLAAARLWILSIPATVLLACAFLTRALPELGDSRRVALWLGALAPFSFMAVLTGQPGGLWLLPLTGGILLLRSGRPLLAGMVLGWLSAKPSLGATAAAWLLLTRQWRAFGGFVLGGASMVGASIAVGGVEPWLAWIEWLRGGELATFRPAKSRQLTLRSLFTRPFLRTRLDAPLGYFAMAMGLATAAYLGRAASRLRNRDSGWVLAAGGSLSATMLALPYIIEYDAGFHLLGLAGAAIHLPRAKRPRLGAILIAGAWLAPFMHPLTRPTKFSWGSLCMALWLLWLVLEVRARYRTSQAVSTDDHSAPTSVASRPVPAMSAETVP
jgi:hypothetical protein